MYDILQYPSDLISKTAKFCDLRSKVRICMYLAETLAVAMRRFNSRGKQLLSNDFFSRLFYAIDKLIMTFENKNRPDFTDGVVLASELLQKFEKCLHKLVKACELHLPFGNDNTINFAERLERVDRDRSLRERLSSCKSYPG